MVDDLYRDESRRDFATLIRLLGNFELAEDALLEYVEKGLDGVSVLPTAVLGPRDIKFNAGELIVQAHALHVQLLAFPEMSITSYTLGDLVHHKVLLSKAVEGLKRLLEMDAGGRDMVVVVGMPLLVDQRIFNCAVIFNRTASGLNGGGTYDHGYSGAGGGSGGCGAKSGGSGQC